MNIIIFKTVDDIVIPTKNIAHMAEVNEDKFNVYVRVNYDI